MRLAAVVVWAIAAGLAFADQCAQGFDPRDSVDSCCPGTMGKNADVKRRVRRTKAAINAAAQAQTNSNKSSSTAMRAFVVVSKGARGGTVAPDDSAGKGGAGSGESGAMMDADDNAQHAEEAAAAAEPGVTTKAKGVDPAVGPGEAAHPSGKTIITSEQAARIAGNKALALEKLEKKLAPPAGGSSQQGAVSLPSGSSAFRTSNEHPQMVGEVGTPI